MSNAEDLYVHRRSSERLRYAVDVANKCVNDAFKTFSNGKKPYHQLFTDVCQDLTAQLDTLNLLIKPLQALAPKFDFEDVEGNGFRSLLNVVDCALKEMIGHVKMCITKHNSFFFSGTAAANKLQLFCVLLSKLGKLLDIATMMGQQLKPESGSLFIEITNPVGKICIQELESLQRECFYGSLVGFQYPANIQRLMKAICVVQTSYGIGYYSHLPTVMGPPSDGKNFLWRSSASIVGGARYWFKEEERAEKFVQLTHKCASTEFTKSFWNLIETGVMAEVPKLVNKKLDVAVEIFITGVPLYVRNKSDEMLLIHPPFSSKGATGVTVGFLSAHFREGQLVSLPLATPIHRSPKCNRLLIHFHGGGFVAGSHTAHETYLRHWCVELDTVIVSINYSLAPENPFPRGLDDCTFAYAWCLENLHSLGCTGKSILFMGDSAGGNLAITTALRANSYGLRGPDAILSAYPVTYVKYAGTPSRLLSGMDVLLPTGVMQCCVRAYAGVPVDNNAMFYEWLQAAESTMSGETIETVVDREIENGYVEISYKEDAASHDEVEEGAASHDEVEEAEMSHDEVEEGAASHDAEANKKPHPILKRLSDNMLLESNNGLIAEKLQEVEEVEVEGDLELVHIRPEVYIREEDYKEEEEVKEGEEEGEEVLEEEGEEVKEEEGAEEEMLSEEEEKGKDNEEDKKEEEKDVGAGSPDISQECPGSEERLRDEEERLRDEEERPRSLTTDLEKMLLEDDVTPFHTTKLVLSPDKTPDKTPTKTPTKTPAKSSEKASKHTKTPPRTPTKPPSPTKSQVYMEPSPLGIMATVVEDKDLFPEPAYVINPGEIATRKNITLLQKYFDDPFMSPYLATDEMLRGLPPVYIVAAELDPLLDDSISFCHKLKKAGGKVKLKIVPGMTHGFLNLVLNSQLCSDAADDCLRILREQFVMVENS